MGRGSLSAGVRVVERTVPLAETGGRTDRRLDVAVRTRDGIFQRKPLRKTDGDGGGEGAAGAVGVLRVDAGRFVSPLAVRGDEKVAYRRPAHVPTFQQHRGGPKREQRRGR